MSAQDMRDMLGLSGEAPRPVKKRKTVEKRSLEKGMAREVSALMGERAPPVSMIQVQPKYKQRPKRHVRATPWNWTPFTNDAREDDLRLYHWQREHVKREPSTTTNGDDIMPSEDADKSRDKPYQFSRFNVRIETPVYDDKLYESTLKDDDWSRAESDYLVDLVRDYGQKWHIVWDRYDFKPAKEEDQDAPREPAIRTMEDLKARYYTIKAKLLAHETPVASMNGQQYSLYQTLINFDAKQETGRKKMSETHLYRSDIEVQEETALLAELQRIMINQTQLEAARHDIRDRLDYPSSSSSIQYTTSQALAQLFQQLVAADRSKKDRRLRDLPAAQAAAVAAASASGPSSHRDSISKRPRDSLASVASDHASTTIAAAHHETRSRALSPHSRDRFFVTLHDRLPSGVTFASDKLSKPRVAKSAVQTERIAAVLQHLKVPDLIPLPTQRVVEEFDKLMAKVATLLDMRKVSEREETEVKVREAEVGIKKGSVGPGAGTGTAGAIASSESGEVGAARGQKRSASVLSNDVDGRGEKRRK